MHRKYLLAAATAMMTVATSPVAFAQESEAVKPVDANQIQDIVVTAQRRAENIQKASISIQVLSKDDIVRTGVTSPRDLNTMVPGLAVSQGATSTQTFIRGVGDITSTAFGSNGVMYTIDGIVIDRPIAITPNFFDLERIEVLKGPQGTLYGRNSTGGAINLLSRRPEATLGGYVTGEIANYGSNSVSGALNLPITSALRARAAFQAIKRNGFLTDGRNDDDRSAARLSIIFEPSDSFSLFLSGDIEHLGGNGPGGVVNPLPAGATTPWTGPSDPLVIAQLRAVSPIALAPVQSAAFLNGDFHNVTAEAKGDLGFATLTVLGGYRYVSVRDRTAQAGFDSGRLETAKQTSLEARLGNQSDKLKWVVGGFYFDEKQYQDAETFISDVIPFGHQRQVMHLPTRSLGAFGEATLSVTSALRLIGGLRYTHEHKEVDAVVTHLGTASLGAAGTFTVNGDEVYNKVTWRAGAEYDLGSANMLYATVSTGFKAGGFSPVLPPNSVYQPEQITSYVVGSRNRFLDNRLQLNVEGFYWNYKDYQATALNPQANGFTSIQTFNAGAATIYGIDVDLVAKLSTNDTVRFVGEYLHTNFDSFTYDRSATGIIPGVTIGCPVGPAHPTALGPVQTVNCSGFELQRSPKWSGSASYQHVFPLANGGDIDFKTAVGFAASRWIAIEYVPIERAKSYVTVDADLTYHAPDDRFLISMFGRNLTNKNYYTGGVLHPFAAGKLLYQTIGAPRTYGARLSVNF